MIKRNIIIFLSIFFIFQCKRENTENLPLLTKDNINGEAFWNRIAVETDFYDYPQWPGYKGLQPGQSPHGVFHEIYINKILRDSLPNKDKIAPDNSIIVKENFNSEKKFDKITAMIKIKDYDPENNDWFYAVFDKNGKVMAEGKVGMCIMCHKGMKDNDYIIVHPLDSDIP